LGDCLESTGNIPTDKLFTGQRLDSTGLYYYGARYYDATIGRFISADSIVQSPTNPQTLNRYSYALNNPLKYVDPTGHEVEIMGHNVDDIYNGSDDLYFWYLSNAGSDFWKLFSAYDTIRSTDGYFQKEMENNNSFTLNIYNKDLGGYILQAGTLGAIGAQTPQGLGKANIEINNNDIFKNRTNDILIDQLSHELLHGYGAMLDTHDAIGDSKYEEAMAGKFAFSICYRLGIKHDGVVQVQEFTEARLTSIYARTGYADHDTYPSVRDTRYIHDLETYSSNLSQHINAWYIAMGVY
jgi:RHS repeat-associated protein